MPSVTIHEFTPNEAAETVNTVAGGIAKVLNDTAAGMIAITAYQCQGNIYVVAVHG